MQFVCMRAESHMRPEPHLKQMEIRTVTSLPDRRMLDGIRRSGSYGIREPQDPGGVSRCRTAPSHMTLPHQCAPEAARLLVAATTTTLPRSRSPSMSASSVLTTDA